MGSLFWRKVAAAFVRAFMITFFAGATGLIDSISGGVSGETDFSIALSGLTALTLASIAAAVRAAQALFTTIETPTLADTPPSAARSVNPPDLVRGEPERIGQPERIPATSAVTVEVINVLRGLTQLRNEGVITDDELTKQKQRLLAV
jgi:hypothetical protein